MIAPDQVFVPDVFRIAPFDNRPVPEIVIGSVTPVSPPDTLTDAPDATLVVDLSVPLSPSEVFFEIATTPVEIVVAPV